MSTYNTRLQAANTDLQSLIDKANALPDAGSGSGGSVETCTVQVEIATGKNVYATVLDANGNIDTNAFIVEESAAGSIGSVTISNVICNSIIYINVSWISCTSGTAIRLDMGDKESWSIFKAPSVAGETCIIGY